VTFFNPPIICPMFQKSFLFNCKALRIYETLFTKHQHFTKVVIPPLSSFFLHVSSIGSNKHLLWFEEIDTKLFLAFSKCIINYLVNNRSSSFFLCFQNERLLQFEETNAKRKIEETLEDMSLMNIA
jgi:hypothetical protein